MRLMKKHEGRPVDFRSCKDPNIIINGRVTYVARGVANIVYWIPGAPVNGFTWWADVRDPRIVAVY